MTDSTAEIQTGFKTIISHHWKALMLLGLITIGAGMGCLVSPNQTSIAVGRVIGIGLILAALPLGMIGPVGRAIVSRPGWGCIRLNRF